MSAPSNWPRNRLLLALPSRNLKHVLPELEYIRCEREQVLMDADSSLDHVFFPDSGVVSVMAVYSEGGTIEMATIGRRAARRCRPSSAPRAPPLVSSSKYPEAQQRCRARLSPAPWGRCRPSEVSCTVTSRPFSSRLWCRSRATVTTASRSG